MIFNRKIKGNATKDGKGWHVEFDDNFMKEFECMPPEVKKEINSLIEGFKNGTIDPIRDGIRCCQWCGGDINDAPMGINSCTKCLNELK